MPPAESAEAFAATVRHLSIRVVPDADHLLKVKDPGHPELVGVWVRVVASGTPLAPVIDPLPVQRVRSEEARPSAPWEGHVILGVRTQKMMCAWNEVPLRVVGWA